MTETHDLPHDLIDVGGEDGLVEVAFNGHRATLDVIEAWERFLAHSRALRDRADFTATLPALAQQLGLPEMSQRVALRFFHKLADLIERIREEDGLAAVEDKPDLAPPPAGDSGVASAVAPMVDAFNGMREELRDAMQTLNEATSAMP